MSGIGPFIADLLDAYPRTKLSANTLAIYRAHLADLAGIDLAALAADLIRTQEFFPTVATIRRTVAEKQLALPTPEEALTLVAYGPAACPDDVRVVVRQLGGFAAYRENPAPGAWRKQFLDLYADRRMRVILDAQREPLNRSISRG